MSPVVTDEVHKINGNDLFQPKYVSQEIKKDEDTGKPKEQQRSQKVANSARTTGLVSSTSSIVLEMTFLLD